MNISMKTWRAALWLSPIFLSVFLNYDSNFFDPEYLKNFGDINFPFNEDYQLREPLDYIWTRFANFGEVQLIVNSVQSDALFLLISKFVSNAVLNRLWYVLPLALVGWSGIYFFTAFKGLNRPRDIILAFTYILFIMAPPVQNYIPLWYLAEAGSLLALASFVKIIKGGKHFYQYLLFAIGITYTLNNPRFSYLVILSLVGGIVYLYRSKSYKQSISLKKIGLAALVTLCLNVFFIAPIASFAFGDGPTSVELAEDSSTYGKDKHKEFLHLHRSIGLFKFYKLIVLKPNLKSTLAHKKSYYRYLYYLNYLILLFPFFFFRYCKNDKIEYALIKAISFPSIFILLSLTNSLMFKNLFLKAYDYIPGFFMLNSVNYIVTFLPIFIGLILVLGLDVFIDKIGTKGYSAKKEKNLRWLTYAINFTLIVFIYSDHMTFKVKQNESSLKVPQEYKELEKLTPEIGNIMTYPLPKSVYSKYNWYNHFDMPDITMAFSGNGILDLSNYENYFNSLRELRKRVKNNTVKKEDLMRFDIKYLLVHKDYVPKQDELVSKIINNLESKNTEVEKIADNALYNLYRSKASISGTVRITLINGKDSFEHVKASFERVNNTHYEFTAKKDGKYNVDLMQKYHQGWKLFLEKDEQGILPSPKNIGYFEKDLHMNTWKEVPLVKGRKYRIKFVHQKAFEIGKMISLVTLLALGALSIFLYMKKEKVSV